MSAWLTNAWMHRGPWACAMWPLHCLMSALTRLRRWMYQRGWLHSQGLPVPVIVVGNRVVGGAGKTPSVIAIVQHLQQQGWSPGIVSRGYGRRSSEPLVLDNRSEPQLNASLVGDEPWLIWRRTRAPLAVHARRHTAAQHLLSAHPGTNVLVCDDGLQHLALQRDIEIVVFDARGAGNGWLLPAGPLREPIDSPGGPGCMAPAMVVYNTSTPSTRLAGFTTQSQLLPLQGLAQWWQGAGLHAQAPCPSDLSAKTCWAVAGMAQPQRFFLSLQGLGLHAGEHFTPCPLPDHAPLDDIPWPAHVRHVIMTEKDAVKITPERVGRERPGCQVWVASLDFQLPSAFWMNLDDRLTCLRAQ